MSDETLPPDEELPEGESAPEPEDEKVCGLCGAEASKENRAFVNRQRVCLACRDQIEEELQAEQGGAGSIPMGLAGGALGAGLGAAIWAGIAILTDFEVGYVAIAVGWLAGKGAVVAAGGKKSSALQITAVAAAAFGLILGKYLTVAHVLKTEFEEFSGLSYFSPDLIKIFVDNIGEFFGGFDILWLVLAVGIAWKVPKPTEISISSSRDAVDPQTGGSGFRILPEDPDED